MEEPAAPVGGERSLIGRANGARDDSRAAIDFKVHLILQANSCAKKTPRMYEVKKT